MSKMPIFDIYLQHSFFGEFNFWEKPDSAPAGRRYRHRDGPAPHPDRRGVAPGGGAPPAPGGGGGGAHLGRGRQWAIKGTARRESYEFLIRNLFQTNR